MSFVQENENNIKTPTKGLKGAMTHKANSNNRSMLSSLITNLSAVTNKKEFLRLEDNTAICKKAESIDNIVKIKNEMISEANKSVDQLKSIISNTTDDRMRNMIRVNSKRKDFQALQQELDEIELEVMVLKTIIKRQRLIESVKCADIVSDYIHKFVTKHEIASLDIDETIATTSFRRDDEDD